MAASQAADCEHISTYESIYLYLKNVLIIVLAFKYQHQKIYIGLWNMPSNKTFLLCTLLYFF